MLFKFQFVNIVYYIDLHILKNPCIPGLNPTWSLCMSFLMCCWILFAKILLRIFASMFISDTGLVFFFCVVFVWFWYQGDGGLIEWVWKCSFLCNFLKEFQKDRYYLFSKCLTEFSCEAISSWAFAFWETFDHRFNSVLVIGLFIISISSWFSFGRLNF